MNSRTVFAVVVTIELILFGLLATPRAHCQEVAIPSYLPQPYVGFGASLMPAGYANLAFRGQGGVYEDYKHIVSDVFLAIDNGKKSNDGTLYNIKGHDDYANAFIAWRPKTDTYYGFGPRWSELISSNYTKGTNLFQSVSSGDFRVQAVIGHDWGGTYRNKAWAIRTQVNYVFPPFHENITYPATSTSPEVVCSGCGNGVQGPEISLFFPSPSVSKHWTFAETFGIYEFHDTYTIPGGYPGERNRHVMATADFVIRYFFFRKY